MPKDIPADLASEAISGDMLEQAVLRASMALHRKQQTDGHWVFELEADATIPAEYVLLEHFLDRIDDDLERKIGVYLRRIQGGHGGWPLFHEGAFNLSASVKAYYALKAIGDDPDAPHMRRAREAILAAGGAERSNVFTRIQLALFGQIPWRGVPVMPAELMIAPKWFPINMWKVSYWSRTVIAPLLVLMDRKPKARNPRNVHVRELFLNDPDRIRDWIRGPFRSGWGHFFKYLDSVLRVVEPVALKPMRPRSIRLAVDFVRERLNGEDGLGAIYPAMANSVMMYDVLGYSPDHPQAAIAWESVRKLLVIKEDEAYCQPCLSPIWDTGLSGHAMAEAEGAVSPGVAAACDWLRNRQITDVVGDWAEIRPGVQPGGWAFQYNNAHYPDVDDTAVVAMLLHRQGDPAHNESIRKAREWIIGLQCRDGGWGAFDADNDKDYLNHIPFADHGALLDPPTADVTARCISFLAQLGNPGDKPVIDRAMTWLRKEQEADGSWFGRWGTNYIYGTWSVLCAMNAAGVPHDDPAIRRAVNFLVATQREDGGWGEDEETYDPASGAQPGRYKESTPSQTAWALIGLMAAGEAEHEATRRGIAYLQATQKPDGEWDEAAYTAVGFPRVFYLKYHGYRQFFPLMALSRYKNLRSSNMKKVSFGF
ncbi:squalene--hopene cyclase [Granulibacter bethesdensis]|uniref:squalene--hopene cyclase n=1 Tax=Granulibacter bethesdensis TaxID=364410 RepID=UPI00090A53EC|nr:squalene--hopene cyclase [Granulibacter bethesdensis]APH60446.1 Squalene--hopene cyclase [Granulibacter bethesdensis]